jgi:hypothetical protein
MTIARLCWMSRPDGSSSRGRGQQSGRQLAQQVVHRRNGVRGGHAVKWQTGKVAQEGLR